MKGQVRLPNLPTPSIGLERYVIIRVLREEERHTLRLAKSKKWTTNGGKIPELGKSAEALGSQPSHAIQDIEKLYKTYNPQGRPTS